MGANLTTDELILTVIEDGGVRRAQLYVCGMQALDEDDARLLLDVLGLNGRVIRNKPRQVYVKRCDMCHHTRQIKGRGLCAGCWERERQASE